MDDDRRWGLYIDIEGFGIRYDQTMEALIPLNALMAGIYQIGTKAYDYTDNVNRLFAHQFGDGFIIVSCFEERSLDRAVSIAISLMRHVLGNGGVAKASIAEGGFSDIKNCYPQPIVDAANGGSLPLGAGVMTIIPVMGTALINAVAIDKKSPSGALLTLHSSNKDRVSSKFEMKAIEKDLVSINWVRGEPDSVTEICTKAALRSGTESDRIDWLRKYIEDNHLPPVWTRTTCYEQRVSI